MVTRRLTKINRIEILEEFRLGESANDLAEKYNCSANTINRTVKTLITDEEYILLKEKRLKIKKTNIKENSIIDSKQESQVLDAKKSQLKYTRDLRNDDSELKYSVDKEDQRLLQETKNINSFPNDKGDISDLDPNTKLIDSENNFEEIVPLISSFGFEKQEQKVDCKSLDSTTLPEIVYMIVDKKVELELQNISDLPEWSFLPDTERERCAILLFTNQRTAKRNCSKNQKVIKIPNTGIFKISKSYLLSKGITRLILEDLLISLDN